jgi:hypothetical protein
MNGTNMTKPAYNILTIPKSDYLRYHWSRTEDARIKLRLGEMEWHMIWSKNYYCEKCEALEKKLYEIQAKNQD